MEHKPLKGFNFVGFFETEHSSITNKTNQLKISIKIYRIVAKNISTF